MDNYRPDGSLYFYEGSEEDVYKMAEVLMAQKYVVMLSKEEGATILSYISTPESGEANRNSVAFMSLYDFEEKVYGREE